MKLLLFSDLHCDLNTAQRLVEQSLQVDLVLCAGDVANIRRGLERTIAVLRAITTPTVLVPGNSETDEELQHACRDWPQAHVLHGRGTTIDGVEIYGLGGGIPITPFGAWSYDFSEAEAEQLLAGCPDQGILVSHSPPEGLVDRDSVGRSLGSTAIRQAIEQRRLDLVVCGHMHASAGQETRLNGTTIINAGPQGVVWSLE